MRPILVLFLFSSLAFSASLTVGARACLDTFCDVAPGTVSGGSVFAGAVGIHPASPLISRRRHRAMSPCSFSDKRIAPISVPCTWRLLAKFVFQRRKA
jgi:hypothetical protein